MNETWWLYMIECQGGGIYSGITKDVQARYEKHAKGKGAKYTKLNRPVQLLCKVKFPNHREAAKFEYQVKQMSRKEKISWILAITNSEAHKNTL